MKNKVLHAYFSRLGKKSAKARMKKITPQERSRIARRAAQARWSQAKAEGQ
jgi:hypothetical protein